jgi:hypothetical protein
MRQGRSVIKQIKKIGSRMTYHLNIKYLYLIVVVKQPYPPANVRKK